MKKLILSALFLGLCLFTSSFTTYDVSGECQTYASNAVEQSMNLGFYADMELNDALGEMEGDFDWYYDYCEANCTECNSPNRKL